MPAPDAMALAPARAVIPAPIDAEAESTTSTAAGFFQGGFRLGRGVVGAAKRDEMCTEMTRSPFWMMSWYTSRKSCAEGWEVVGRVGLSTSRL